MSTKPISPDEVMAIAIPDFVIRAVNQVIVENYRGSRFTVSQEKMVQAILDHGSEHLTMSDVFDKKYLDFEMVYREHGWDVVYDKPGYNEGGEACFVFKPKLKS